MDKKEKNHIEKKDKPVQKAVRVYNFPSLGISIKASNMNEAHKAIKSTLELNKKAND